MKKRSRRRKIGFIMLALALLLAVGGLMFMQNMTRQLSMLAEARAKAMITATVNETLSEVLQSSLKYSDLVTTIKDAEGSIIYIQANAIRMNDLAYSVSEMVQNKLAKKEDMGINIKLGAAMGSDLLSGSGPDINVKLRLVGNTSAELASEFESTGINQTRHKIILVVKNSVKIILPSSSSTVDVSTQVSLFEGIIVGKVPEYYLNAPDDDPYLNLVPGT